MEAIGITAGSYISHFGTTEDTLQNWLYSEKTEEIQSSILNLDLNEYECGKQVMYFERAAIFLNIAAEKTMNRFRNEQKSVSPADIGISGGNVYGSIGTWESMSKGIQEKGMKAIRVKNGTNSILCGPVSKTGEIQKLKGQNISNCNGDTASLDALIYGIDAINIGMIPYFLVGGTEEYSKILQQKQQEGENRQFSEGAATFIIGRNLFCPDAKIIGTGKAFTCDKNYKEVLNKAIRKAIKSCNEEVEIDFVICGRLYTEQEEEFLRSVLEDNFKTDKIPYWSSRWIFGDVAGANGAFQVISALQIIKDNKLPHNCKNMGEIKDINNILILDYDIEGQASCLLLSR